MLKEKFLEIEAYMHQCMNDSAHDREHVYRVENLYDKFYTRRGIELSIERQKAAVDFYNNMLQEVQLSYALGKEQLNIVLD